MNWIVSSLCSLLLLAGTLFADGVAPEPVGSLISSKAVAFNPRTGKTYVVDARQNKIWIIDRQAKTAVSLDAGHGPVAIAVNSKTNRVYATLSSDGAVAVIDGNTDAVLARPKVGPHPYTLAVDEANNRVYVTNTFSDIVAVIHGDTNAVDQLHLGAADGVAVDSKTEKVLLISYEDPNLKIVDARTGAVEKVSVGEHLWGLTVSEATGKVYLTRIGASELIVVDERTHDKQAISVGQFPCAVAVDEVAHRIFVVNYGDGSVTTLDAANLRTLATTPVGPHPESIAIGSEHKTAYVPSLQDGTIRSIDENTGSAIETFPAGENPYGIGLSADPNIVVVASLGRRPISANLRRVQSRLGCSEFGTRHFALATYGNEKGGYSGQGHMRFYTEKDCEQWLGVRQRIKPSRSSARHTETVKYPSEPYRVFLIAHWIASSLTHRMPTLLWISEWGVWPSSENWHIYYKLRQSYGDHHLLAEAPGHLFLEHEAEDLASFLQLAMLNGWDGYVLTQADYVNVFFSHDEYLEFFASEEGNLVEVRDALQAASRRGRNVNKEGSA